MIKIITLSATTVEKGGTRHTTDPNEMITMNMMSHKQKIIPDQTGLEVVKASTRT